MHMEERRSPFGANRFSVPTRPTDPLLLAAARQGARNSRWSFYGKAKAGWGNLGHVGTLDELSTAKRSDARIFQPPRPRTLEALRKL